MVGRSYWAGLLEWIRESLLTSGAIEETDLELLQVTDDPDEVVTIIRAFTVAQEREAQEREAQPTGG